MTSPSSCVLWMSTILLIVRTFCLWVECPLYDLPKWVRSRSLLWIMSLLASFFFERTINKWFIYVDFIVLYSITCRWGESVILWEGNMSQVAKVVETWAFGRNQSYKLWNYSLVIFRQQGFLLGVEVFYYYLDFNFCGIMFGSVI